MSCGLNRKEPNMGITNAQKRKRAKRKKRAVPEQAIVLSNKKREGWIMIILKPNWEEQLIEKHKGGKADQWDTHLRRTLKGRINDIKKLIIEGKAVIKDREEG